MAKLKKVATVAMPNCCDGVDALHTEVTAPQAMEAHPEAEQAYACNTRGSKLQRRYSPGRHTALVGPAVVPQASPAQRPAAYPMMPKGLILVIDHPGPPSLP